MSLPWHQRADCRLCGSLELEAALRLTPTPLANAFVSEAARHTPQPVYPLELELCRACGHLQLRDVIDPALLFENYVYVSGTSSSFVAHFERYADELARHCPPGSLVIDVGSNDGTLLRFFKQRGFRVLGIDPARGIAQAASAAGIETLPSFLTPALAQELVRTRGRAALVTANNVFAHVDDLRGFVAAVRGLLAPEGLFTFEVSYLADVHEKCLFDTIYHEHLDYHTVAPLERFFAREGMDLIRVERVPTHGGSIRGVAQLAGAGRARDRSVDELIALERSRALDKPETFAEFGRRIGRVGERLRDTLKELKGATIAGFGAPAKATTLMYHLGIGAHDIEFIVDDSPLKQGLYTPGMHIPVLPPKAIEERRPDVLVLLAWNFAEPIIAKHRDFLRRGGKFLVPLPEVRLVADG